jgi:hypothetical protein
MVARLRSLTHRRQDPGERPGERPGEHPGEHRRRRWYGCAIGLLCFALAACQLTEVAAPATTPTPQRTPTPVLPPALSPLASTVPSADRTATPVGTRVGTPAATPAGGPAGTATAIRTPTPGTTTPDRTATPIGAIGSTATPGGTTAPGGATTPRPAPTTAPGAQGTAPPTATVARGTIQLVSYRSSVQGGDYVVTGEVQNNTSFNPRTVRIAGTVYDAEGRSLDTAETILGGDTPLQPGEVRSFTLRFRSDARIVRYYLDIETQ